MKVDVEVYQRMCNKKKNRNAKEKFAMIIVEI